MKRANWALRASSLLVLGAAGAGCAYIEPDAPPPDTVHLTVAEFASVTPGELHSPPPEYLESLPAVTWNPVALPHALPRVLIPVSGSKDTSRLPSITLWYRIEVPASRVTPALNALYVPRWHTWGYLTVYANRKLIYS